MKNPDMNDKNNKGNSEKTYYEILEVEKKASAAEIKNKYRELALKYHPDKLPADKKAWGEQKIKEINEANEVLKDERKREIYDKFGKDGLENNGPGGFPGGFPGFAGFPGGFPMGGDFMDMFKKKEKKEKIEPVIIQEEVTLEEIYNGKHVKREIDRYDLCKSCEGTGNTDKKIHICNTCNGKGSVVQIVQVAPGFIQQMQKPCHDCRGIGREMIDNLKCKKCNGETKKKSKINIEYDLEPGIKNGDYVKLKNLGHEIPKDKRRGEDRGDIVIIIREKEHSIFKHDARNPANICIKMTISLAEALCGFSRTINHLDGRKLDILEGSPIKNGDVKYVPDEGLPIKGKTYKKGDLFIKYEVEYPTELPKDIKKNLYKLLTGKPLENFNNNKEYVKTIQLSSYENKGFDSDEEEEQPRAERVDCATQ